MPGNSGTIGNDKPHECAIYWSTSPIRNIKKHNEYWEKNNFNKIGIGSG